MAATACSSGSAGVVAIADSDFDQHTSSPSAAEWQWMRDHYARLVVWAPYWDNRLQHFDDVLVYQDAYAVDVDENLVNQHPNWVMREADGTPTYVDFACGQSGGCPQYAFDIGNANFVQYQLDQIQDLVDKGYPGVIIDDVNMLHRWSDRWGNAVTPIDPRTGSPILLSNWRNYMANYVEAVRSTFPNLEIMHNSIWYSDSPDFDDNRINRQIRAADYVMLERGATDNGLVAGSGKWGFQTFLAFVDRIHDQGSYALLLDEDGNTADQRFNLAATLLINHGPDLVGSENPARTAPGSYWSGFNTDLGYADGDRRLHNGFIVRDFSDGKVVLREPGLGWKTYQLGTTMIDSSGNSVTSVSLNGGKAEILRFP